MLNGARILELELIHWLPVYDEMIFFRYTQNNSRHPFSSLSLALINMSREMTYEYQPARGSSIECESNAFLLLFLVTRWWHEKKVYECESKTGKRKYLKQISRTNEWVNKSKQIWSFCVGFSESSGKSNKNIKKRFFLQILHFHLHLPLIHSPSPINIFNSNKHLRLHGSRLIYSLLWAKYWVQQSRREFFSV